VRPTLFSALISRVYVFVPVRFGSVHSFLVLLDSFGHRRFSHAYFADVKDDSTVSLLSVMWGSRAKLLPRAHTSTKAGSGSGSSANKNSSAHSGSAAGKRGVVGMVALGAAATHSKRDSMQNKDLASSAQEL
jgi:hypothetical protein